MYFSTFMTMAASISLASLAVASPVFDWPDTIERKYIPAGIEVHEFNATEAKLEAGMLSSHDVSILKKRSDCRGSGLCSSTRASSCISASSQYDDSAYYCGYTSRFNNHCTAIYRCDGAYDTCLRGDFLKSQFTKIYSVIGCGICGTYDIPNGAVKNCHVTYNYCGSCTSSG